MSYLQNRIFCILGGLMGAGGIAAYAASAHISGGYYAALAPVLLGNATILVVLGLLKIESVTARIGGLLISIGVVLFGVDLTLLQCCGHHLFHYAAPLGGITIILGWLVFIITALLPTF